MLAALIANPPDALSSLSPEDTQALFSARLSKLQRDNLHMMQALEAYGRGYAWKSWYVYSSYYLFLLYVWLELNY